MGNENSKPDEKPEEKWTGRVSEGLVAGKAMQTRFKRIPDSHLNAETVAGIRDMNLGRVRNGERIGAPTIRFDTGHNSGAHPHINIDPRGFPNRNNPHIDVSGSVVQGAKIANTTLKYVGRGLTVAAVVVDTYRFGSAFVDDLYIRDHLYEIIRELEDVIEQLEKALKTVDTNSEREEIRKTLEHYRQVLREVKRNRVVPNKTIKTGASIAGGWGAGIAGGAGGAWAGAQMGAGIGTFFGPIGTVVGAPIGAVIGAIGGGVSSGIVGSALAEGVAEKGLQLLDDD